MQRFIWRLDFKWFHGKMRLYLIKTKMAKISFKKYFRLNRYRLMVENRYSIWKRLKGMDNNSTPWVQPTRAFNRWYSKFSYAKKPRNFGIFPNTTCYNPRKKKSPCIHRKSSRKRFINTNSYMHLIFFFQFMTIATRNTI